MIVKVPFDSKELIAQASPWGLQIYKQNANCQFGFYLLLIDVQANWMVASCKHLLVLFICEQERNCTGISFLFIKYIYMSTSLLIRNDHLLDQLLRAKRDFFTRSWARKEFTVWLLTCLHMHKPKRWLYSATFNQNTHLWETHKVRLWLLSCS